MTFSQLDSPVALRARRSNTGVFVCFCRRVALQAIAGALATVILSTTSWAAFVTTQEAQMDAIFGQTSFTTTFGIAPVDIVYLPTITYVDPTLLNIDTPAKVNTLFNLFNSSTIHYAYFVDTISECGGFNTAIVGCGNFPGNDYVVESNYAAGGNGAELMAHELSHNLGLGHDTQPAANLMDPALNGNTMLTSSQATTIFNNAQGSFASRFVQIQPILILATSPVPVPEPSTALLAASLLGIFACRSRRRRI